MKESLRGFALALLLLWAILLMAAFLYSQDQGIPSAVVFAVVPAFLLEAGFYLASGTEAVRARLESLAPATLAVCMTLSAPVSYAMYTLPLGLFDWRSVAAILGLAAFSSFFYVLLPRRPALDLVFLACLAAVVLLKIFQRLYPSPLPRLELFVLGTAMWVRTGILAVLSIRRMEGIGFGFLPRGKDWAIGLRYYVFYIPIGLGLALWLGFVRLQPKPFSGRLVLLAIGTFFAMLWVVALSEEFFFRGILQQMLSKVLGRDAWGLVLASAVFGAAHLPFRQFPNWRFAILAALAGLFYGIAYRKAGSIRAAMVAHALVNTTWRVLLG